MKLRIQSSFGFGLSIFFPSALMNIQFLCESGILSTCYVPPVLNEVNWLSCFLACFSPFSPLSLVFKHVRYRSASWDHFASHWSYFWHNLNTNQHHPIKSRAGQGFLSSSSSSSSSSSCLICPYKRCSNLCCRVQFLLHSASVLQYNNMNVAGVYPSVFFVSKNVVPFVNSKENYWTYMKKKSYFKLFFGFFCYIYFLVLESSL